MPSNSYPKTDHIVPSQSLSSQAYVSPSSRISSHSSVETICCAAVEAPSFVAPPISPNLIPQLADAALEYNSLCENDSKLPPSPFHSGCGFSVRPTIRLIGNRRALATALVERVNEYARISLNPQTSRNRRASYTITKIQVSVTDVLLVDVKHRTTSYT